MLFRRSFSKVDSRETVPPKPVLLSRDCERERDDDDDENALGRASE